MRVAALRIQIGSVQLHEVSMPSALLVKASELYAAYGEPATEVRAPPPPAHAACDVSVASHPPR